MININDFGKPELKTLAIDDVRLPNNSDGYKVREIDDTSDSYLNLVLYILTNGRTMNPVNVRLQKGMKQAVVFGGCHRMAAYHHANRIITSPDALAEFEEEIGETLDNKSFVEPITEIPSQVWDISPEEAHALGMLENLGVKPMSEVEQSEAIAAYLARKANQKKAISDLANSMGVSESTVKNMRALSGPNVTPTVRTAIEEGKVLPSVAYALCRLPRGEMDNWLEFATGPVPAQEKIKAIGTRARELSEGAAPGGDAARRAVAQAEVKPRRMTPGQMNAMLNELLDGDASVLGPKMSKFEQTVRISLLQEICGLPSMTVPRFEDEGVTPREDTGEEKVA